MTDFIFFSYKITADGDYSHEIKTCLFLGRKAMTSLDSVLKSREKFANKGLYSQRCSFSSSHVQMWDHKENWALKNWCLLIVVLEQTLERSLDSKEIKSVNPGRNQPYSLEGLMLKLKLQYSDHLIKGSTHQKRSWCWERLKAEGEEDGRGWLDSITDSTDVNLSKLWETVKDREGWCAAVHGVVHNLATEQQQIYLWQYGWTWGHYARWNNSDKDKYHRISVQFSRSVTSDSLWLHGM